MGRIIRKRIKNNIKPKDNAISSWDLSKRRIPENETVYQRRSAIDILSIIVLDDHLNKVEDINVYVPEEKNYRLNKELNSKL